VEAVLAVAMTVVAAVVISGLFMVLLLRCKGENRGLGGGRSGDDGDDDDVVGMVVVVAVADVVCKE
jgi:hypothetical protein